MRARRLSGDLVLAAAAVAGTTALALALDANATTAGFALLLAVLVLAASRGFVAGLLASVAGAACFNFWFFPPLRTFHVTAPGDWVAIGAFVAVTLVASRLLARERARALEAEARRREIQALYELCVDLFAAGARPDGLSSAITRALRTIGARSGGLELRGADGSTIWFGEERDREAEAFLARGATTVESLSGPWRNARLPVRSGDEIVGTLIARGVAARQETLQSVARLAGLALERELLLEKRAQLDVLESRDAWRTALVRAIAHDLSTPLTAVGLQLGALRRELPTAAMRSVDQVEQQVRRLHHRIEGLLAMARIDAGSLPRTEPTPPADLFRAVREALPWIAAARPLVVRVDEDVRDADVDPSLALEILVNLVENADAASPPGAAVELAATASDGGVFLDVCDRGPGPPAAGAAPREERRGLGLLIAGKLAAASGGSVVLHARAGGGTIARLVLPSARLALHEERS